MPRYNRVLSSKRLFNVFGIFAILAIVATGLSLAKCGESEQGSSKTSSAYNPHQSEENEIQEEEALVRKALSLYFAKHRQYPKDMEELVKESFLERGSVKHIAYWPEEGYGSYGLSCPLPEGGCAILAGPPPREVSDEVLVAGWRERLRGYYLDHGQYPKDLQEIVQEIEAESGCRSSECNKAIPEIFRHIASDQYEEFMKRGFDYSVSEDLQSFTLDGKTLGIPSTWPSDTKLMSTDSKMQTMERWLNIFFDYNKRYPRNLKEMVDDAHVSMPAKELKDLTEGENIVYRVSEDGKTAYLNGKQIQP